MTPPAPQLRSSRLTLVPATIAMLDAAIDDLAELGCLLNAAIPATWPPQFLDEGAFRYTIAKLTEHGDTPDWWMYFVVLTMPGQRTLIGTAGYKGPPSGQGSVEIGYGIVADHHRRGYATEAAMLLIEKARETPGIREVTAETMPELVGSIGVLERCGFRFAGPGSEDGVIRFVLPLTSA